MEWEGTLNENVNRDGKRKNLVMSVSNIPLGHTDHRK